MYLLKFVGSVIVMVCMCSLKYVSLAWSVTSAYLYIFKKR